MHAKVSILVPQQQWLALLSALPHRPVGLKSPQSIWAHRTAEPVAHERGLRIAIRGYTIVKRTNCLRGIAAVGLLLAVAGCGKDTPAQTRANVAEAQDAGMKGVDNSRRDEAGKMADARENLANAQTDVAHADAEAARSVATAKVEAAHKVAIARCDGDFGDARRACTDLADSKLAAAKASANAIKVINDPKA